MDFSFLSFAMGGGLSLALMILPRLSSRIRGGKQIAQNQKHIQNLVSEQEFYRDEFLDLLEKHSQAKLQLESNLGEGLSPSKEISLHKNTQQLTENNLEDILDYTEYFNRIKENPRDSKAGKDVVQDYTDKMYRTTWDLIKQIDKMSSESNILKNEANYGTRLEALQEKLTLLSKRSEKISQRYSASYIHALPGVTYQAEKAVGKFIEKWNPQTYATEGAEIVSHGGVDPFVTVHKHLTRLERTMDSIEDFRGTAVFITEKIRRIMKHQANAINASVENADKVTIFRLLSEIDSMEYDKGNPIDDFVKKFTPIMESLFFVARNLAKSRNNRDQQMLRFLQDVQKEVNSLVSNSGS